MNCNKNIFKNIKTIFFDFDGTLNDSIKIYAPAFKKAYKYLVDSKLAKSKEWSNNEISYWLGYNSKDMWKEFMPDLDEKAKQKASKIIGTEMMSLISEGKAELYEGTEEVLMYLKNKNYKLVFISNCSSYYKKSVCEFFKLNDYFDELVCSEGFDFIPKYEILNKIKHKYSDDMVIIGDRFQDLETGKKNDIYTIGCEYGFGLEGELKEADCVIKDIRELEKIL